KILVGNQRGMTAGQGGVSGQECNCRSVVCALLVGQRLDQLARKALEFLLAFLVNVAAFHSAPGREMRKMTVFHDLNAATAEQHRGRLLKGRRFRLPLVLTENPSRGAQPDCQMKCEQPDGPYAHDGVLPMMARKSRRGGNSFSDEKSVMTRLIAHN